MKFITRFVLAASALAIAGVASAAPFDSADQARREQNREEVLAKHGVSPAAYRSSDSRPAEERTTLREKTHRAAESTRSFTHRQAEKARNFGARQNAKASRQSTPAKDPYKHGP